MAGGVNFKVRKGLEVTDSATIGGGLIASGLQYPLSDGSANQVIKTDGSGNLSFGQVSIGGIEDVSLTGLADGDLLIYNSATELWEASDEIAISIDGGTF